MSSSPRPSATSVGIHPGGSVTPLSLGLRVLLVGAIRHNQIGGNPITRSELRRRFEQTEAAAKLLCDMLDSVSYLPWLAAFGKLPVNSTRRSLDDLLQRTQNILASVRRGRGGDKAYPGSALSARGLCWAL